MRIEVFSAAVLGLGLTAALAAEASASPCSQRPAVFAHAGAGSLGPAGISEQSLGFTLPKAGRVWAEADGLQGLGQEDRDAAPEVFLDDNYLGPLLPDFGAAWRSPRALMLAAGPHTLLVRCAQPGGEGPVLRWKSLDVLGDPHCPPAPKAVSRRRAPVLALVYDVVPDLPCGARRVREDWPSHLKGESLVLSSSNLRAVDGGPLVRLGSGQVWRARVKIPLGAGGQALPLMAYFVQDAPDHVRFVLALDRNARGGVHALGYRPGVWEPLVLSLCSGELDLTFAREPTLRFPCAVPNVSFDVAVRDLAVSLAPFR